MTKNLPGSIVLNGVATEFQGMAENGLCWESFNGAIDCTLVSLRGNVDGR